MARGPDLRGTRRLRPRLGRTPGAPGLKRFVAHVLSANNTAEAALGASGRRRSGRTPSAGRGGGAAWTAHRSLTSDRARRVIVKAHIVPHRARMAPLGAHLGYLRREGVTRDGTPARMFDAASEDADIGGFAERCAGDRRHFRFIVSPEDAADLTDLRAYTRDLVREMERDLGTRLEWIAVDHWNTDNPHVHLIVRGIGEEGDALVIHRDYISRGMRARAVELATLELGPRSEWDVHRKLALDVDAERWAGLDRAIQRVAERSPGGVIDLRPDPAADGDPRTRALVIGRLRRLEGMGLARAISPAQWLLADEAEGRLKELGERGDILKAMHRTMGRVVSDPMIHHEAPERPIVGRVAGKGLHDELVGSGYVVIDGADGRAHYVTLAPGADLTGVPEDGIVAVAPGRLGTARVRVLSWLSLETQIEAAGATWLDRELVGREPTELTDAGFGAAIRQALDERAAVLVEQGLAVRGRGRVVFARDLITTLERGDLDDAAARLTEESGLDYRRLREDDTVAGIYRRRIDLASGPYAMIESNNGAFTLVPWRRELGNQLGREVSAVVRGRDVDWTIGPDRGLDIS
jgi:type IV secretory pathway VirD2 relaxase